MDWKNALNITHKFIIPGTQLLNLMINNLMIKNMAEKLGETICENVKLNHNWKSEN